MKVIVNRTALDKAIQKIISEKSTHSARIDTIAGQIASEEPEGEIQEPIQASELMSNPLTVDRPPVDQEGFVPRSTKELSFSAAVIAEEVPEKQVEFFYRRLHALLDDALDREAENDGNQQLSEAAIRQIVSLIVETDAQDSDDDELPFESEEAEDAAWDRIAARTGDDVQRLSDDVFDFEHDMIEKWISAGMLSDARRNLESRFAEIFARPKDVSGMVISILSQPQFQSKVSDAAASMNVRPEAIKLAVIRDYEKSYPKEIDEPSPLAGDLRQTEMNQKLAKEFDTLLPENSYEEIISIYERRLEDENIADDIAQGYRDMIALIRGRQRDPRKRERTDLSVKQRRVSMPDIEEELPQEKTEEERLKALDSLAPFFGFKNASGIRQWRRKYAEPKLRAILGATRGKKAYEGYSERVMDNMAALLDRFSDFAATTLTNIESSVSRSPDDAELVELRDSFKYIADQIEKMHEQSLDSETGMPEADMLRNSAAGMMLRVAFADLYFNNQFRDFAKNMKDHMIVFLTGLGVDSGVTKTFSKMFNGEVDLVSLSDDKAQARKLVDGGITQETWDRAVKESERFTEEFFTGEKQKEADRKYAALLNDDKKLSAAFEKSIDEAIESYEMEERLSQAEAGDDQEGDDELQESFIKSVISRIMA